MVSTDFDAEHFERRLQTLKDSQESIQSLSAWCLERRQHHKKIVSTWLQVLKKVKTEHRLTLFYLANDVIQYSKRKNYEFVESWGTTLQRATTMVRDEKVKHRILRIFKIWDQRSVYDEEFLADLSGLISAAPKKKVEPQNIQQSEEFQAALLISTMRSCATLEQATDARLRDLKGTNIDIENAEELCSSLKDRRRVEDAEKEVDHAARNIESYVRSLEAELRERKQVLDLLEQADQFYETQRGEVKIVVNAYKNFGSRVKNLKKKLDELLPLLASPLPSPDINAPSPSPDSDIELPEEKQNSQTLIKVAPPSIYGSYRQDYNPTTTCINDPNTDFTNNFSSFIGGNLNFDPTIIFNDNSTSSQYDSVQNESSEIINVSSKIESKHEEPALNFLKTVLPSDSPLESCAIPGLGDVSDSLPESEGQNNYSCITSVPIHSICNKTTSKNNINNNQAACRLSLKSKNSDESQILSPYASENSQSNVATSSLFEPAISTPLPPPPMPPIEFLEDNNSYSKLPPKFPTWTFASEIPKEPVKWTEDKVVFPIVNDTSPVWPVRPIDEKTKNQWNETTNHQWDMPNELNSWSDNNGMKSNILTETPESPPMFEKTGFVPPVEYNDSHTQESILSSVGDVDHRVLPRPMSIEKHLPQHVMDSGDIDHRNLISLTGSPANNSNDALPGIQHHILWTNTDQDYRKNTTSAGDNVESVDMEMSDEENEKKINRGNLDLRSQDRDMRIPLNLLASTFLTSPTDLDMRHRLTSVNLANISKSPQQRSGNLNLDLRGVDTRPPPPPPLPAANQEKSNISINHSTFRHNKSVDLKYNQSFHQNQNFSLDRDLRPDLNQQDFQHTTEHQDYRSNFNLQDGRRPFTQDFRLNQNFPSQVVQDFHSGTKDINIFDGVSKRGSSLQRGISNRGLTSGTFRGRPPWINRQDNRSMVLGSFFSPSTTTRGMKSRGTPFRGTTIYRNRSRGGSHGW